jgi:putative oxidoreductase
VVSRHASFVPVVSFVNLLFSEWGIVQRLFSTFADGWPGAGILLLRLLAGAALIAFGISSIREGPLPLTVALQIIGIAAAVLLLVGAFTPLAGVLAAAAKLWIAISQFFSHSGDPWVALAQAVLAAALAMIGPGSWSIDARRFGRKHIDLPER